VKIFIWLIAIYFTIANKNDHNDDFEYFKKQEGQLHYEKAKKFTSKSLKFLFTFLGIINTSLNNGCETVESGRTLQKSLKPLFCKNNACNLFKNVTELLKNTAKFYKKNCQFIPVIVIPSIRFTF
jgi:hypothetical protein